MCAIGGKARNYGDTLYTCVRMCTWCVCVCIRATYVCACDAKYAHPRVPSARPQRETKR